MQRHPKRPCEIGACRPQRHRIQAAAAAAARPSSPAASSTSHWLTAAPCMGPCGRAAPGTCHPPRARRTPSAPDPAPRLRAPSSRQPARRRLLAQPGSLGHRSSPTVAPRSHRSARGRARTRRAPRQRDCPPHLARRWSIASRPAPRRRWHRLSPGASPRLRTRHRRLRRSCRAADGPYPARQLSACCRVGAAIRADCPSRDAGRSGSSGDASKRHAARSRRLPAGSAGPSDRRCAQPLRRPIRRRGACKQPGPRRCMAATNSWRPRTIGRSRWFRSHASVAQQMRARASTIRQPHWPQVTRRPFVVTRLSALAFGASPHACR